MDVCVRPASTNLLLLTILLLRVDATSNKVHPVNDTALSAQSTSVTLPLRANQSISACILDVTLSENLNVLTIFTRWVTPILFGLFLIVGSVGNLLVIIVVLVNAQMRNATNILILSLAVADLAFILICIPLTTVIYIMGGWPMGTALCRVYFYLMYVTAYCSVYTLVLMSLDRFLAVVYPIKSIHWRNQTNTIRIVLLTWFVVLYCTYAWLVTIDEETQTARDNYEKSAESKRSKKRATLLVVTVVVVFGISWLPIHIVFLIQYYVGDPNTDFFRILQILSNSLAYGNSSINPILYAFLSVNFRKAFIDLLNGSRKPATTNTNGNPQALEELRPIASEMPVIDSDMSKTTHTTYGWNGSETNHDPICDTVSNLMPTDENNFVHSLQARRNKANSKPALHSHDRHSAHLLLRSRTKRWKIGIPNDSHLLQACMC
ncbi:unnamed protein product [Echinostoma caproni]|uniref:G_PROTEIN_RECEP_F1_2 domain-containing protein n=1 Tax=Echinostoma caproni TaxID=27848 RepID=A0A183A9V0_9TREM|nr:unnamed protein product [Echinostoma caproni]